MLLLILRISIAYYGAYGFSGQPKPLSEDPRWGARPAGFHNGLNLWRRQSVLNLVDVDWRNSTRCLPPGSS